MVVADIVLFVVVLVRTGVLAAEPRHRMDFELEVLLAALWIDRALSEAHGDGLGRIGDRQHFVTVALLVVPPRRHLVVGVEEGRVGDGHVAAAGLRDQPFGSDALPSGSHCRGHSNSDIII